MYQDSVYVGSVSGLGASQQRNKIKYAIAMLYDGEQFSNVTRQVETLAMFQDWELFSNVIGQGIHQQYFNIGNSSAM